MIDSSVLLPEPEAPTMATVSARRRLKSISRRMVSVPVESDTDLNTCLTSIITSDMKHSLKTNRRHFSLSLLAALAFAPAGALHAQGKAAPVVLVVGDSLSAEYGLKRGSGWVALTEERLKDEKVPAQVVNASISGDTTSGG